MLSAVGLRFAEPRNRWRGSFHAKTPEGGTYGSLKGGETIKAVGQAARAELEEFMGRKVHLFLTVKVKENWLEDPERYGEMGLDFRDGA
jgi:hypothetical protein